MSCGDPRLAGLLVVALLPGLAGFDLLRGPNRDVEEGNRELADGKPEDALKAYDRAAKVVGDDPAYHFDRGTALLALKHLAEAQAELQRSAEETSDPALEAEAFYNLGNTFFAEKQYKDAIGAYVRTLRLTPQDRRAKWNLELALRAEKAEEEKRKREQSPSSQPNPSSQPSSQPSAKNAPGKHKPGAPKPPQARTNPASQPAQPQPATPSDLDKQKVDHLLDAMDHNKPLIPPTAAGSEPQPEEDW